MKKNYITPAVIVAQAAMSTFIATSDIDYGGSNSGEDKPHTAETKGGMWDFMSDDEK